MLMMYEYDPRISIPGNPTKCTARKSDTGEPCKAWAISGGNVCVYHGGKAPQVRAKARQRLEEASDVAAEELIRLALDPDTPYNARVRALVEILSRGGAPPRTEATLEVAQAEAIERPDLDAAIARAMEARGMLPAVDDDEAIEAEVVDDEA